MTIAGGFLCPDGIVLCADQQITNSDFSKSTARKIWGRQYPSSLCSHYRIKRLGLFGI